MQPYYFDIEDRNDYFNSITVVPEENIENRYETRPQISSRSDESINNEFISNILNKENEYIYKDITNRNKNIKSNNILNTNLGEIFENTSNVITDFWTNYKQKIVETKYELDEDKTTPNSGSFSSLLKIHTISFVKYLISSSAEFLK